MKTFALIGAAGYIAPRHMKAIKDVGARLEAALDPCDSVGVMDQFFPEARFFVEFERLDRHMDLMRRMGQGIEYVSICSPNYLHDAHARFSLRSGADAICEKPLVLNPWNLDGLVELEQSSNQKVNTILQLRLHPEIEKLRAQIMSGPDDKIHDVDLTYITARGRWYQVSWKGDEAKSGGIGSNLGIHFFDMLGHVFGKLKSSVIHLREDGRAAGYLEYQRARVRWFLSLKKEDNPDTADEAKTTYRLVTVDGNEVEFSSGFTDLHTESYRRIISGKGYGLVDVRPSVELAASMRSAKLEPRRGDIHPQARKYIET